MMKKFNILIPIGCRSDEGLSAPLIRRLRESDWCECYTIPLSPANYIKSYKIIEKHLSLSNYDLVIITGDRIEMEACAKCCFLHNIPIGHFYAGIITNRVTFDGILRHQITLMADMAFCEDEDSVWKVIELWTCIGKHSNTLNWEDNNIHNVGISHLDDLEIDESLVPSEPYDLILINSVTTKENKSTGRIETHFDSGIFGKDIDHSKSIWIGANPDFSIKSAPGTYYENLPRPQFLGLLKNCSRFFTNSSCSYYEAPYFLKPEQIIQVGLRNKGRSTPKKLEVGASDKIVKILKEWWLKKCESV